MHSESGIKRPFGMINERLLSFNVEDAKDDKVHWQRPYAITFSKVKVAKGRGVVYLGLRGDEKS
jgi:hypothetical protein